MRRVKQVKPTKRKKKKAVSGQTPGKQRQSPKPKQKKKKVTPGKDSTTVPTLSKIGWKKHQQYRDAAQAAISVEDIAAVYRALLKRAKKGDVKAATLLLTRLFGKVDHTTLPLHWERKQLSKTKPKRERTTDEEKKDDRKEAIAFYKRIIADLSIDMDYRIKCRDKLDELLGFKKIKVDFNPEELGQDIRDFVAQAEAQENNRDDVDTGIAE